MPHRASTEAEQQWLAEYQEWVKSDPHLQLVNHIMDEEILDDAVWLAARALWLAIVDRKVSADGNPLDWNLPSVLTPAQ